MARLQLTLMTLTAHFVFVGQLLHSDGTEDLCVAVQNANRRPTTFKLLLLPIIRQKAEELGVPMMDQQTLTEMAEKLMPKV